MEIWKDIKGYEGLYQVSNHGRVKSLARLKAPRGDGWRAPVKERILKKQLDKKKYFRVSLYKDGKQSTFRIYILVAIAFLGHEPNGHKIVVDHIDFNSKNDHVDNLQLVTNRVNCTKDLNRSKCASKYLGVSKNGRNWKASIKINGERKHLGSFKNEIHAHKAYQEALSKLN